MATTRLDMRLEERVKAAAEKAAALKGMKSLTEYVVRLIEEDSEQVIKQYASIRVEDDVFDRFITACESLDQPNQKLRDAKAFADAQGIR